MHGKKNIKVISFFLILFCTDIACASVVIDKADSRIFFGNRVEYYVDKNDLTFPEILKQKSGWARKSVSHLGFGLTKSACWVKFELENKIDQELYLTFSLVNADNINLYILNKDGTYTEKTGGIIYPFSHREVYDKDTFFIIPQSNEKITIYACFKTNYLMNITPEILTGNKRFERAIKAYMSGAFSHGILLALLIYHLFLFISSREKPYLFLVLLIAAFQLYDMAHDGLGNMFIWPGSVFFERLVIPLSIGLIGVSSGGFIQLSVETKKKFKSIHYFFSVCICIGIALCFSSFVFGRSLNMGFTLLYATFSSVLTLVLLFYMGVIRKNRSAFFIFAVYFFFEVSNVIAISTTSSAMLNFIPFLNNSFLILKVSKYVRVSILLMFSFVLMDKINSMKKQIARSEETYRSIFNGTSEAICIIDRVNFTVTDVNSTMLELFNIDDKEVKGYTLDHFSFMENGNENEKIDNIYRTALSRSTVQTEWVFKKSTGETFWADITVNNVSLRGEEMLMLVIRDISDKKIAEEEKEKIMKQLIQAQKMEAVGSLAGGLAHDFNNILTGILGSSNVAKIFIESDELKKEKIEKYLDIIEDLSIKASGIVKQLLTITRKHELKFVPANLNRILKNVVQVCLNSFPKSITLETEYQDLPAMVNADIAGLEQVFLNLFINASHAMTIMRSPSEPEGGIISLKIARQLADDIFCKAHKDAVEGIYYFSVSIEDNGCGIDKDKLEKIFDPFFTTKDESTGSGLGLSMVYSIINRHKGMIKVYSEKEEGTMFIVYLPEDAGASKSDPVEKQSLKKWHGTILVIDDEEFIRQVAEAILKNCGYHVLDASSGVEGIETFQSNTGSVDLVLLDVSMPGLSGLETFKALKEIQPDIKVILSSGFSMDERVKKAFELGLDDFIQKPYTDVQLSNIVYEVLVSDLKSGKPGKI